MINDLKDVKIQMQKLLEEKLGKEEADALKKEAHEKYDGYKKKMVEHAQMNEALKDIFGSLMGFIDGIAEKVKEDNLPADALHAAYPFAKILCENLSTLYLFEPNDAIEESVALAKKIVKDVENIMRDK